MFLQALDLEYVEVISKLLQSKEEEPSINRLRAFLEAVTARYDAAAQIPGIAFGAALADTSGDSEVGSRLRRFLSVLDRVAGEILGPDASPLVATLLSTFAIGLCLRSRSGTQPPEGLGLPALMLLLTQGSTSASSSWEPLVNIWTTAYEAARREFRAAGLRASALTLGLLRPPAGEAFTVSAVARSYSALSLRAFATTIAPVMIDRVSAASFWDPPRAISFSRHIL
jgi:hypothetical protein